jgi:hypothetical protein
MVYGLRRHRLDDYRGRYRIWLWGALGCLLASIDAATALHAALASLLVDAAGTSLYGDGAVWWLAVYAAVFGLGAGRFVFEMSPCRSAVASLLAASGAYLVGALVELQVLLPTCETLAVMAQSTCLMLAHLGVLLSVALYCRYVYREAQGELSSRSRQRRVADTDRQGRAAPSPKRGRRPRATRVDGAHEGPAAARDAIGHSRESDPPANDEAIEEPSGAAGRLSKAERRRLRKKQRRQRRAT